MLSKEIKIAPLWRLVRVAREKNPRYFNGRGEQVNTTLARGRASNYTSQKTEPSRKRKELVESNQKRL